MPESGYHLLRLGKQTIVINVGSGVMDPMAEILDNIPWTPELLRQYELMATGFVNPMARVDHTRIKVGVPQNLGLDDQLISLSENNPFFSSPYDPFNMDR